MNSILTKILPERLRKEEPGEPKPSVINTETINASRSLYLGRVLGFYIDDSSLQMTAVSHIGNRRQLLALQKVSLAKIASGQVDSAGTISQAISKFVKQYGSREARIHLAVSGIETAYRIFYMPLLTGRDLDEAVSFELRRQIPFPTETCYHDYRALYKITGSEKARLRIAVLAATRNFIDHILNKFTEADVQVEKVYLSQVAMGHLLDSLPNYDESFNYTIINFQHNSAEISFYRGTTLEFFSIVSSGTSMLAGGDDTHYEFFAESLVGELTTALDYYTGQFSRNYAEDIYLSGDFSNSEKLLKNLNDIGTYVFSSFPTQVLPLKISSKNIDSESTSQVLPALAVAVSNRNLSNLLPKDEIQSIRNSRLGSYCRSVVLVIGIILLTSWLGMKTNTELQKNDLTTIQKKIATFEASDYFHEYKLLKQQINDDRLYLNQVQRVPSYLHLTLKMLSRLTPVEIQLYYVDYDKSMEEFNFGIHGKVIADGIPPEVILAEFTETLIASPLFENVKIDRHSKRLVNDHFELDFNMAMRAII